MDKTLYTLIVHSENFAGLLNQLTHYISIPQQKQVFPPAFALGMNFCNFTP